MRIKEIKLMEKELLKKWLLYAKSDMDVARRIFESPKPNNLAYLLALWHCQQAIEKMLKMLMLKNGKELLRIHDLSRLAELSEVKLSEQQKEFLKDLNEFYLRSRYPDLIYRPLPKPSKDFTEDCLKRTKKLFLWLKKQ